ncbi:sensor histidine kinase [Sphingomonas sp. MMS24-J13]|uniref:sensor histidine kinase n=1 Tax=Sphingomonas sp. MMS24-J13 TaxID=3238686 RepID=UPI00384E4BDB
MSSWSTRTVRTLVFRWMVLFGLTTVLLACGAYAYSRHTMSGQLNARMERRALSLEHAFARGGKVDVMALALRLTQRGTRTFAYTLVDAQGYLVMGVAEAAHQPIGWSTLSLPDLDDDRLDDARVLTRRLPDGSRLSIIADGDIVDQFDGAFFAFLLAAFGLLFGAALIGALSLERIVRRRLDTITGTARSIIAGETASRIKLSGHGDEFDAVCAVLNTMLDGRDEAIGHVRRITGYIAHDLRAPLVRLREDLARSGEDCGDTQRCVLDLRSAIARCDEILEIYEAILAIGEIEAFGIGRHAAPFSLSTLMGDLAESFAEAMEAGGRTLRTEIAADVIVGGNRGMLTQLIVNLLDNAATHTPVGTVVTMRLEADAAETRIIVADDGAARAPTPRTEASREREGLGLRLVEAIAGAHGGRVVATPGAAGMTVSVSLPRPCKTSGIPGWPGCRRPLCQANLTLVRRR